MRSALSDRLPIGAPGDQEIDRCWFRLRFENHALAIEKTRCWARVALRLAQASILGVNN